MEFANCVDISTDEDPQVECICQLGRIKDQSGTDTIQYCREIPFHTEVLDLLTYSDTLRTRLKCHSSQFVTVSISILGSN